jgi:hypothetical protein
LFRNQPVIANLELSVQICPCCNSQDFPCCHTRFLFHPSVFFSFETFSYSIILRVINWCIIWY